MLLDRQQAERVILADRRAIVPGAVHGAGLEDRHVRAVAGDVVPGGVQQRAEQRGRIVD